MGIHRSFIIGNDGEAFITSLFLSADIECEKHTDKETRHEHDLTCKIGKKKFKCEIKYDLMAEKTSNLAIETHNCKKDTPSGIEATKADIWGVVLRDGENKVAYLASVKRLKEFCNSAIPLKKIVAGGDKNANLLIFKCDQILPEVFHRMETLNKEDLHKLVKKLIKENK